MYSNDYSDIRNGLTNYVGAIIKSLNQEDKEIAANIIVSILLEEALKISIINNRYNLCAIKPIIKATKYLLNDVSLNKIKNNQYEIESYNEVIKLIDNILKKDFNFNEKKTKIQK